MNAIAQISYAGSQMPEAVQAEAVAALEDGRIVFLENLGFKFSEAEQALFGSSLGDGVQKNITLDPYLGKLSGVGETGEQTRNMIEGMLSRYRATTQNWLANILGPYADHLEPRRTTYRPVEIAGRKKIGKVSEDKAYRFDDSLLHLDAFRRRPIRGNRIFRIFTNINPHGKPRTWKVGHGFEAFARRYLEDIPEPRFGEGFKTMALAAHALRSRHAEPA